VLHPSFTIAIPASTMCVPSEKIPFRRRVNAVKESHTIMGDKSPKANHKKSGQKQSKANNAAQNKKSAVVAKQAAGKKK